MQQETETAVIVAVAEEERRANRRVRISRTILARPADPKYQEEVQTTLNSSRDGLYFETQAKHYRLGMHLDVTLGYAANDPCNTRSVGKVVRVDRLEDGRLGIAVRITLR
jgi:hypothetical protein